MSLWAVPWKCARLMSHFLEFFLDSRRSRRGSPPTKAHHQYWNVHGLRESQCSRKKERTSPLLTAAVSLPKGGTQPSFRLQRRLSRTDSTLDFEKKKKNKKRPLIDPLYSFRNLALYGSHTALSSGGRVSSPALPTDFATAEHINSTSSFGFGYGRGTVLREPKRPSFTSRPRDCCNVGIGRVLLSKPREPGFTRRHCEFGCCGGTASPTPKDLTTVGASTVATFAALHFAIPRGRGSPTDFPTAVAAEMIVSFTPGPR